MSRRQSVELTAMPLVTLPDGRVEGRDTIGAYLIREEEGARTLLQLVHGYDEPVVLLTLDEAGRLRDLLDRHIARSTPLGDTKVYDIVSEAMGGRYPITEVAETLGIDLATATREDGWRLSACYGTRLGDKH